MEIKNLRKMIVLKNIPSNMIEEAIIVLKQNVNEKNLKVINNNYKNKYSEKNNKDYIVKEAELIVSDYIKNIEKNKFKRIKIQRKKILLGTLTFFVFFAILGITLIM